VTSESESSTVPWIEKTGAKYAYAYDKGGKVARFFGVSGIPHAILVDPAGKVVWRGHPASLDAGTIESGIAGALTRPLYSWPSSAKAAAQAVVKGDWAGALEKAAKIGEEDGGPGIVAEIQGLIESRVKVAEAALAEGNFYEAQEQGEALVKGLRGLPEQERAQKVVDGVDQHPDAKKVLDAQKKIRKIRSKEPSKRKDVEKAMEDMKDIVKDLPGTYAAQEASAYMEQLRGLLRR
jgi:hypothetical protein